jgi:hypothetical protein
MGCSSPSVMIGVNFSSCLCPSSSPPPSLAASARGSDVRAAHRGAEYCTAGTACAAAGAVGLSINRSIRVEPFGYLTVHTRYGAGSESRRVRPATRYQQSHVTCAGEPTTSWSGSCRDLKWPAGRLWPGRSKHLTAEFVDDGGASLGRHNAIDPLDALPAGNRSKKVKRLQRVRNPVLDSLEPLLRRVREGPGSRRNRCSAEVVGLVPRAEVGRRPSPSSGFGA